MARRRGVKPLPTRDSLRRFSLEQLFCRGERGQAPYLHLHLQPLWERIRAIDVLSDRGKPSPYAFVGIFSLFMMHYGSIFHVKYNLSIEKVMAVLCFRFRR